MSRVGKKPIEIPSGVKITVREDRVMVEGPKGKLETRLPNGIGVELKEGELLARRRNEEKSVRALHGLTRSLLANAVQGVTAGFSRQLEVVGIGYKAEVRGEYLTLGLGFSHPIQFPIPSGIEIKVERNRRSIPNYVGTLVVAGIDKARVGQIAAEIHRLRPPDAYKGKGIRYSDEVVRLKVGKKGA
ncbi:MAG: 50S ribosomal protein L6 [Acidobacteriota bacterium]